VGATTIVNIVKRYKQNQFKIVHKNSRAGRTWNTINRQMERWLCRPRQLKNMKTMS